MVPRRAFKKSTAKITIALSGSPVTMDTAAAAIKITTRRSLNCSKKTCHQGRRGFSWIVFSPYFSRRIAASSSVSPRRLEESSRKISSSDLLYHSVMPASPFLFLCFSLYRRSFFNAWKRKMLPGPFLERSRKHPVGALCLIYEMTLSLMTAGRQRIIAETSYEIPHGSRQSAKRPL